MITLHDGDGGLAFISVQNQAARAKICLLGATVMEYQPAGAEPVLWTSPNSRFAVGTPIRGGIPVCWPWFGQSATPGLPAHGFVRTLLWEVSRAEEESAEQTLVELACHENEETLKLWPHAFNLRLRVHVGAELRVELETSNRGALEFDFSAALHTYFAISDIGDIQIDGLEKTPFLSKVHNFARFVESAPLRIGEQVDRVYLDTETACTIHDAAGRRIVVEKYGSRTTVVWNPWAKLAAEMADLGPETYRKYVCLETVVGPQEEMKLAAGETHVLKQRIRVEA
jgi:glucose-6-phosphate 1-epimerase